MCKWDLCSNPYYSRVNCSSVWCAQHCDEYQQKVRYWGKMVKPVYSWCWQVMRKMKRGWLVENGAGLLKVQGSV